MGIKVKVIEDSISSAGIRLTTLQVRFPRFVLPEFNTHRAFSRNFSSSRAIPVKKMIDMVRTEPAMPVHWGENQAGMQASNELDNFQKKRAGDAWCRAAQCAANFADKLMELGLHKQVANRVMEPFLMVDGIVTATEFENFFELRCHKDAQPEIQCLANEMRNQMERSKPNLLHFGEWHLPYVTQDERNDAHFADKPELLRNISAARCCRVSYLKHDGTAASIADDLALCERLAGTRPIHASPFEHQATPMPESQFSVVDFAEGRICDGVSHIDWDGVAWSGNFAGWIQYRKLIEEAFAS